MHSFGAQSFRLGFHLAMSAVIVCMSTSSAHAYLDPGTGSIILQVLLGGVAGLALACKLYWQKFVSLIGGGNEVRDSKPFSVKPSVEADGRGRH